MASSSEDSMSALKFAKLNGGNYQTWAFNMRSYLESLDLFEHVDGSAEPPEDVNETRSFRLRSKKAWMYICLTVLSLNSRYMCEIQRQPGKLGSP
eukprot:gene4939-5585_t